MEECGFFIYLRCTKENLNNFCFNSYFYKFTIYSYRLGNFKDQKKLKIFNDCINLLTRR